MHICLLQICALSGSGICGLSQASTLDLSLLMSALRRRHMTCASPAWRCRPGLLQSRVLSGSGRLRFGQDLGPSAVQAELRTALSSEPGNAHICTLAQAYNVCLTCVALPPGSAAESCALGVRPSPI